MYLVRTIPLQLTRVILDPISGQIMTTELFSTSVKLPASNQWGKQLIEDITSAFSKVTKIIDDVNASFAAATQEIKKSISEAKDDILLSVVAVEKVADAAKLQADTNAFDLMELKKKFDKLHREFCCQTKENTSFKEQSVKQELYSRSDNLVFTGIPDRKDETDGQCRTSLHQFFENKLKLTSAASKNIQFVRCHRLGTFKAGSHRSVIARFVNFNDRQSVWMACKQLRGQPYSISEDFPRRIAFRRRLLYPIFREAKKSGLYQSVSLKQDELYINNQKYTVANLNSLPVHINPRTMSCRSNDTTYVGGGLYSEYNLLSNWSRTDFLYNEYQYYNVEQCFQHHKALQCHEQKTAFEILCASDPREAKELGRSITMTTQQKKTWEAKREDLMGSIVRAKVNQNSKVRDALRATGTKRLGESGVHDQTYTIGMKLTNPRVLMSGEWNTKGNIMGRILEKVRNEL